MSRREASMTLTQTDRGWTVTASTGCGHGSVVRTVPDTSRGAKPGATRSESVPCDCGGAS